MGPWAGRVALVGFGIVAALAVLEGLLRLGAVLYESRPAADKHVSLASGGVYRVLCLGESTTAGLVWGEEAYPRQLERILNERAAGRAEFQVINGGMVATTSDVILARLPGMLEELRPHIVVTMMGINDGTLKNPAFQVGGSLRVWKLLKMLYHTYNPPSAAEQAEELLLRATQSVRNWPDVAAELAERAIQIAPDDPRGFVLLAEARVRQEQRAAAREAYARAVETDSGGVLAYAFEAEDRFLPSLDQALSKYPTESNAFASRAVLALRRGDRASAQFYAVMSTRLDSENVAALVLQGRLLQLSGLKNEALRKFEEAAALNPRLVGLLEKVAFLRSPELHDVAGRHLAKDVAPAARTAGAERWFLRSEERLAKQFRGLRLRAAWERIARGETDRAADDLEDITDVQDDEDPWLRLRALGQQAILAWQLGDAAQAEQYHQRLEQVLAHWENPVTADNYLALWKQLHERGIPLVAVQYPVRRLGSLHEMLASASNVVFVDNERVFKDALLGRPYSEIFVDLFAGDFGHMTPEGNRILAANVAEAILGLVPEAGEGAP
jgi:lysophospholipase L1-like esterase